MSRKPDLSRCGAFSLIEVVMATGLMVFALLVISSLIPVGLGSMRDTNQQIVETEIFNAIGAELTATPFAELPEYVNEGFPRFLNFEGAPCEEGENHVFVVRCYLADPELGAGETRRAIAAVGLRVDPGATRTGEPYQRATKQSYLLVNRG